MSGVERRFEMNHQQSPLDFEQSSTNNSSKLSEDDGMGLLRDKMREIYNDSTIPAPEKAKRMHALMARDHIIINHQKDIPIMSSTTNQFVISDSDRQATYRPITLSAKSSQAINDNNLVLGCYHYARKVKVQCADCHLWFTCRHCHDSSDILPFPHLLNRPKTQNMLCMSCGVAQRAGQDCMSCGIETAYYYCSKCKLWDDDSNKKIYHCDDCGICRRGEGLGKDYIHCRRCNVCISISTSIAHPCIERATDCDCPLCLEYLFSSSTPVVSLLCGHYMHASCWKDLMHVTYRCPVCNKSAVNMELQWRKLDEEIRAQPMPDDEFEINDRLVHSTDSRLSGGLSNLTIFNNAGLARNLPRRVWVGCNDCGGRGWSNFHWIGLKCSICDGYNTVQMTPTGSTESSTTIIGNNRQRQHDFNGVAAIQTYDQVHNDDMTRRNDRSPDRSIRSQSSTSYFLSQSPPSSSNTMTDIPSSRSWASSLSPSRLAARAISTARSVSNADNTNEHNIDTRNRSISDPNHNRDDPEFYLISHATTLLTRLAISPSEFLNRAGISPSEFLSRLATISAPDFVELRKKFAVTTDGSGLIEYLQKLVGKSLDPMMTYINNLETGARNTATATANKASEVAAFALNEVGERFSRRDIADILNGWDNVWQSRQSLFNDAIMKDDNDDDNDDEYDNEYDNENDNDDEDEDADNDNNGDDIIEDEDDWDILGHI